jgi:mRNA turnover protein 4
MVGHAQLLRLIGEKMVGFRVGLRARWDSATGEVEDVTDPGVRLDLDLDADADADEDSEESQMGGEDDDEAISE